MDSDIRKLERKYLISPTRTNALRLAQALARAGHNEKSQELKDSLWEPVKLRISKDLLEEWQECERGSYEDYINNLQGLANNGDLEAAKRFVLLELRPADTLTNLQEIEYYQEDIFSWGVEGPHTLEILERWRSKVDIRTLQEAEILLWTLNTGTLSISRSRAAERWYDKIAKLIETHRQQTS